MVTGLRWAPTALVVFTLQLLPAAVDRWQFEGILTQVDPALAPHLVSGWVAVGDFLAEPSVFEEDAAITNADSGRLMGGITDAQLSVELYYQVEFTASQAEGPSGLDYFNDQQEAQGRDAIAWFIPLTGAIEGTSWQVQWLQIWLFDNQGLMIRRLPLQLPPTGLDWESGWIRITFVNEAGDEALAEGSLTLFGPASSSKPTTHERDWHALADDLALRLRQQDAVVADLRTELNQARDRMNSLRDMVNALIDERSQLEAENQRLQERLAAANTDALKELDSLKIDNVLLEVALEEAMVSVDDLYGKLLESEAKREELLAKIESVELPESSPAEASDQPVQAQLPVALGPSRTPATMTIVERPPVIHTGDTPRLVPAFNPRTAPAQESSSAGRTSARPRKYR